MPVPPPLATTSTTHLRPQPTPTFDDSNEITHRVEFDAPLSGDVHPLTHGRFSIDFSLDLERQLAMESPPTSPGRLPLPDPDVLAHIVTQLRQSLADMTKERDDLLKLLATAATQEASAKDALQLMTDKATEADEELTAARKKMREDEEQIVMLRAKVEESRRGLMRLQTESRRQSVTPIDVARASTLGLAGFTSPPLSSKRASFTPLTGSGHRRISSVSDSQFLAGFPTPDLTPSPNTQSFNAARDPAISTAPSSSRRFSGLFNGRHSPPDMISPPDSQSNAAELETLRGTLKSVRDELNHVKHDLQEANEAREASETCVSALREFIAENNIGASVVKLPPPPTMMNAEDVHTADPKKTSTGWGFKLWGSERLDSPLKTSGPFSASIQPPTPINTAQPMSAAPLSRKLGGLWSSRSSVSSTASPVVSRESSKEQRDSVYSYSDASSVTEPLSPGEDIHGLGSVGYVKPEIKDEGVVGRDLTNLSEPVKKVAPPHLAEVDLDGGLR